MLGVLGQATLNFVAVATLLFFFFSDCHKFCDLAKQRRKIFWGVSEVGKIDFALYFFWLCVFFLVFHFLLLRSRDESERAVQPPETPRMEIKVVKEVARGVVKVDPLTARGARRRLLLHPLQPQVTPRNAPRGITLPLRGITPRRGDWPGWPSLSWLQVRMSSSLMRSRGAAPKRRT